MNFWTEQRLNRLILSLAIILIFLFIANFIKVDYFITAPGMTLPLDQIITTEIGSKDAKGAFYLTSVTSKQANLFSFILFSILHPKGFELTPKKDVLLEDMSMEEYVEIMRDMMLESQMFAKVVALREMGYETDISGKGARIVEILATSKAKGILKKGDIIVGINGNPIRLASEAVSQIRKQDIGDIVTIDVKRDDQKLMFEVEIIESFDEPGIGIYIMTHERDFSFPVEIEIAAENIIGPSAGTMFTLEIINQLAKEDITHGNQIAGTGTIDLDGNIGPISGVTQKVLTAEKEGVDYFLAPVENYAEANEVATTIKVVEIDTIENTLKFLNSLSEKN